VEACVDGHSAIIIVILRPTRDADGDERARDGEDGGGFGEGVGEVWHGVDQEEGSFIC
jgi:hypothetical protein